ncbi:zincbinding dehydrogenase family oxidoreductase [Acanthamoeba castellanii str. Neff]|uniref:Zincbinding dehydrogenase family oxidoreductase n=1 Tax=Acanthamoeba castellanii (strain ATCC 30010 / Neff) TaxID=1257118 RepID=L8GSD4_ACACF|nr:zincbinding dehydrogenase family oxidoreductase [Acanthamoeba castellanii str. Neff]ELR15857.1 zincbinding dehydrogenase family oxidoreductase [Acanthamoeba castellanii str. Neff]
MSSKTMRAVSVGEPGTVADDVPRPELKHAYLLVKITALNHAHTGQQLPKYPPPQGDPAVLGLEMAGVVEEVGEGVTSFKAGDRVCALLGGGLAEYCVIHQDTAMHIPENLSDEEAAAIPEVFLTAYQALVWIGGLEANKRVLIHAGVIITALKDKLSFCHEVGADETIDLRENEGRWADKVLSLTGGKGVDIIIDVVGAPFWEQNLAALAMDGTLVLLAFWSGSQIFSCDVVAILRKRLSIRGSTLRARSLNYQMKLTKLHALGKEFEAFAMDKFEGRLKAVKTCSYLESGHRLGKIE